MTLGLPFAGPWQQLSSAVAPILELQAQQMKATSNNRLNSPKSWWLPVTLVVRVAH